MNNSQSADYLSFNESPIQNRGRRDWNNRFPKGTQHSGGFSNGLRQSYSPYHHNQNKNRGFNKFPGGGARGSNDISEYIHPSMLQDPWRALEQSKTATKSQNTSCNSEPLSDKSVLHII